MPAAVRDSGIDARDVIGIGTDFTACTVLPVLDDGTPLCEVPELADRPHAYVKLWKHHAAQPHADRINALAAERGEPWLARYGGRISSEWEFAKGLQLLEEDPDDLPAHGALDRGRRLDRVAAQRRLRPQRVHRRLQGDPAGRRLSVAASSSPRSTRSSPTSSPTRSSARSPELGDRVGSLTADGGGAGPDFRPASRSAPGTSMPT